VRILKTNELELLSFPDTNVIAMSIDIVNRKVVIETDTYYLDGVDKLCDDCKLEIKDWLDLDVECHFGVLNKTEKLSVEAYEPLVDICIFEYGETVLFAGFGKKTRHWIEYKFLKPVMTVSISEIETICD
jgi:hypothetical protein